MGVWAVSLTTALMFPCHSNDSFEGEPEEKRRKTTNVVIEQPATDSKVLIDNVPDNSSLFEEVWDMHTCLFFLPHIELLTFNCLLCLSYICAYVYMCVYIQCMYVRVYFYFLFFLLHRLRNGPWKASVMNCAMTSSTPPGRYWKTH